MHQATQLIKERYSREVKLHQEQVESSAEGLVSHNIENQSSNSPWEKCWYLVFNHTPNKDYLPRNTLEGRKKKTLYMIKFYTRRTVVDVKATSTWEKKREEDWFKSENEGEWGCWGGESALEKAGRRAKRCERGTHAPAAAPRLRGHRAGRRGAPPLPPPRWGDPVRRGVGASRAPPSPCSGSAPPPTPRSAS